MSGFSFFTENEESDAGCAWVQDDGFYYIPDLEGEWQNPMLHLSGSI